jgi:hypothetical protein
MRRTLLVYAVLLIAVLVASYLSWTAKQEPGEKQAIVIMHAETDEIERVLYDAEDLDLDLERQKDDAGAFVWVKSVKLVAKKVEPLPKPEPGTGTGTGTDTAQGTEAEAGGTDTVPDDLTEAAEMLAEAAAESEAPEPEKVEESKEFKAGDSGDKLFEALSPLRAKRELADLSEEKLAELGLDEPSAVLTIERKGKEPKVLELGGDMFGGSSKYVRDRDSGKVYLVDGKALKPLERGDRRLADRRLRKEKPAEIVSVSVKSEAGSIELEQRNRDDKERAYWAIKGAEGASDTAKTWLSKVFRLRSRGYVQADEQPTEPEAVFTVDIAGEDGTTTHVEILRGQDPEGETAWYARSDHTRGLVKLHTTAASEAAQDLDSVLDASEG